MPPRCAMLGGFAIGARVANAKCQRVRSMPGVNVIDWAWFNVPLNTL